MGADRVALGAGDRGREWGRLAPPFPIDRCANIDCTTATTAETLTERGAYVYRDLETGKLVVLCGDCGRHAELNHRDRFLLVAL